MTKKHFKAIAEIISHYRGDDNVISADSIIERLSEYLATQNSQFDCQKFIDACK